MSQARDGNLREPNYFWIAAVQLTTTVSGATLDCWGVDVDEESLSILRHRVHWPATAVEPRHSCAEEGLRHSGIELTGRVDRHRHQGPVRSEVEQFLAVRSPDRMAPSVRDT